MCGVVGHKQVSRVGDDTVVPPSEVVVCVGCGCEYCHDTVVVHVVACHRAEDRIVGSCGNSVSLVGESIGDGQRGVAEVADRSELDNIVDAKRSPREGMCRGSDNDGVGSKRHLPFAPDATGRPCKAEPIGIAPPETSQGEGQVCRSSNVVAER